MEYVMMASTVMQAMGAISEGNAAAAQAKAQGRALEANAQIQRDNARQASREASAAEDSQRRQARQVLGKQRASIAEAGIGFTGSSLDIVNQSTLNAELDALNIRYEGEMRRRGLINDANFTQFEADQSFAAAKQYKRAGYMKAAATIMDGASKAYGAQYNPGGSMGSGGGISTYNRSPSYGSSDWASQRGRSILLGRS